MANDKDDLMVKMLTTQVKMVSAIEGTTYQSAFRDVLTDLRYVADNLGLDFDLAVDGSAYVHFEETNILCEA